MYKKFGITQQNVLCIIPVDFATIKRACEKSDIQDTPQTRWAIVMKRGLAQAA